MEGKEYDEDVIEYEANPLQGIEIISEEEEDDEYLQEVYEKDGFAGFECVNQSPALGLVLAKNPIYTEALKKWGIDPDKKPVEEEPEKK